jgi:heparin binding hemagglutinin HbhA
MMANETKTRIPAPLYAAAGAGDIAYEQLRKLPAVVTELRGKALAGTTDLRERAVAGTTELRERAVAGLKAANASATDLREKAIDLRERATTADLDKWREAARRNATAVVAGAQAVYTQLVARGERVVGTGVIQAADTVNADLETTEAPSEIPAPKGGVTAITEAASKTQAKAEPKPVKRTRPAPHPGPVGISFYPWKSERRSSTTTSAS